MNTEKYLTYRGDVRALAAAGGKLAFVTVHPEGLPTAVYRLDPERLTLTETPLPAGGVALLAAGDDLYAAATDRRLYHLPPKKDAKPVPLGAEFAAVPAALAPLASDRLAVAAGPKVVVLARGDGAVSQTLDLSESVTCLASDPTGKWLVAGTEKGTVAVFECETDAAAYQQSDARPLHEAAVTALLFEADELRFLSAGADQKLLSTHARGTLEAEDRGRGATQEQPVTAMIAAGVADRFLTGSRDGTLKSWPRGKGARPVTLKDVGKVVALSAIRVHDKPQAVAACEDNIIRFYHLDDEGKFGDEAARVHGAADWADHELGQPDPRRREAALKTLAEWADAAAVERVAMQLTRDSDHTLRLAACKLLGESKHPRAAKLLEKGLLHREEAVRLAAFDGLRRHAGPNDLRPLALALKAEKADVGRRAVEALEGLAAKDGEALARLTGALGSKTPEVRRAALTSLEKVRGPKSPEPSLTALTTEHADLRRLALLRLHQRKLLGDPRVQAALRWRGEDGDPEVRRIAFLLSLYTREKLVRTLRSRDPELERQLAELESGALEAATAAASSPAAAAPAPVAALPVNLADPAARLAQVEAMRARLLQQVATAGGAVPEKMKGALGSLMAHLEAMLQGRKPSQPAPPAAGSGGEEEGE